MPLRFSSAAVRDGKNYPDDDDGPPEPSYESTGDDEGDGDDDDDDDDGGNSANAGDDDGEDQLDQDDPGNFIEIRFTIVLKLLCMQYRFVCERHRTTFCT